MSEQIQNEPCHFDVILRLKRDITYVEVTRHLRRLEDWLLDQELQTDGGHTGFRVHAERELSPTDQANLLLTLLDDPLVRWAAAGPLTKGAADSHAADEDGSAGRAHRLWIEADRQDPLVQAARLLYEAGRLDTTGFFQALGGYVQRLSPGWAKEPRA